MQKKLPISLVVITKNEEKNIARCLQSVPWAHEKVVLDSGSADRTCEIARNLGARVETEEWLGFGAQKHRAAHLPSSPWILSLDADEELSPELSEEIQALFSSLDPEVGYYLPRKSFYLGRWIMHGGWYPDAQLRLFHRDYSQWTKDSIHERVVAKKTLRLKNPILHYVFNSISHQVQTNDRYSSLQAQDAAVKGATASLYKMIMKPPFKFLECYFWKLGFLDGLPGFIIAVSAAYSAFLRWSKIWEINTQKKS